MVGQYDYVGLNDQLPLTQEERARAARAAEDFKNSIEQRECRIFEQGLDTAVWLPAANWDLSLRRPLYDDRIPQLLANLDLLRFQGGHFTGYDLATLGGAVERRPPDEMAAALSAYMAANRDEVAVNRYRHHVADLPAWLRVAPPPKFGEIGWLIDGAIVNHDTVAYAERLALLYTSGLLDQLRQKPDCRVLEIGGGYGALAYYLKQAIPQMTYYIVDIPESLVFSSIYLSVLVGSGIHFVPNYEFPQLTNSAEQFDLVINTLSMSEMTEQQVEEYCCGIQEMIGNFGKFFDQNQDNRPVGFINAQDIIERFFMKRISLGHLQQGFANIWEQPRPMPSV